MEGKKRKRDGEQPLTVVTFSAPQNRTFDRVLRDQTFSEVKALVRKKLGLDASQQLSLVQLRDGKEVDLEDEDDYDAFRALSRTIPNLHVVIRVGGESSRRAQTAPTTNAQARPGNMAPVLSAGQATPGPSSRRLDTADAEEGRSTTSSPRKGQKSSTDCLPQLSVLDGASEAPPPLKKRKKKHKAREMSSGSVADLSSNVPDTAVEAPSTQKPSGPFVVDSTEPSRPVSPEARPMTHAAEKVAKKKADVDKQRPAQTARAPEAPIQDASQKSKKRPAEETEDTDQPLAKKSKKKSKESQAEQSAPAASSPRTVEAVEAPAKTKKKRKDAVVAGEGQSTVPDATESILPEVTPVPTKSSKKKASAATSLPTPTTAATNAETSDKPKKKKSKAEKEAGTKGDAAKDTQGTDAAHDHNAASSKEAEGPAAPEPKSKRSRKTKEKPSPEDVAHLDNDIFAAISIVLTKNKANGTPTANHADPQPPAEAPRSSPVSGSVPKKVAVKATSVTRKQPAKSRLSTSWGPADITETSVSSDVQQEVPTADPDDTSISVAISRAHERASAAVPKSSTTPASSAPANAKTVGESSASHVSAPPEPTRRLSGVISAGTQFSEVPIQGHNEGSSDESDEDNDAEEVEASGARNVSEAKTPVSQLNSVTNSANLSEMDVEALLRGPMPRKSILALLPSDSSDEEKSDSEDDEDKELASEAEEKQEQAYRRMSKRFERHAPSSSDEEPLDDDEVVPGEKEGEPGTPASPLNEDEAEDGSNSVESPAPVAAEGPNSGALLSSTLDVKLEEDARQEPSQSADASLPGHAQETDVEEDATAPTSGVTEPAEVEPAGQHASEWVEAKRAETADGHEEQSEETQSALEPEAGPDEEATADLPQENEQGNMEPASIDPVPKAGTPISPEDDQEDPIEPSEDFEKQSDIELEDPIELDEAEAPEKAVTPPVSPLKPGRAKRMKDRYGNLPTAGALSASQPVRRSSRAASRQPEALGQRAETAPPAPIPEEEPSQTDAPVRRSSRKSPQEPTAQPVPSSAPAPEPVPEAPVTKRRGRPPTKTAEEKAKIAADKEAEKKRKAEEREAEKQRKAAEKKAAAEEKARLKAEKAAAAKAKKAGASRKSLGKGADTAEADAGPLSTQTPRPQETASAAVKSQITNAEVPLSSPGVSTAKWTALSQASSFPEADTSMVDELRSSSEVGDDSMLNPHDEEEAVDGDQDEARDSDDDTPTVKVPSRSQPLFAPSDSQNLNATPYSSSQPVPGSSQSQSQSPSKFKRPIAFKPQFRRLSDIASQDLFSPRSPVSSVPLPSQRRQSTATVDDRRASMYGDLADIASDSSSESGSDEEPLSHIPKHRRAGLQKKEMFVE